jgi:hypothetical protein
MLHGGAKRRIKMLALSLELNIIVNSTMELNIIVNSTSMS